MKIKPGPHVYDLSGLISSGVVSHRSEGIVLKEHRPGVDRQSPAQLAVRNSFRACGSLFRSLPESARAWLDQYTLPRPLTSSSVFVRDNRTPIQNATLLSPVPLNPYVGRISDLLFSTPAAGDTPDGRILATWSDNSPTAFTKAQLLIRSPSKNSFSFLFTPNSAAESLLLTGLAFETLYDCYGYFLDPVDSVCGTSAGQLAVLSSAYEGPPAADYIGAGAGNDVANGEYREHTVSDGVPNFMLGDHVCYLYRYTWDLNQIWAVDPILDNEVPLYEKLFTSDTPFLGQYDVIVGNAPGVTIAAG